MPEQVLEWNVERDESVSGRSYAQMARALTIASVKLLNDGNRIPVLGLGTWLDSGQAVSLGLKHGYRLFDTASLYE